MKKFAVLLIILIAITCTYSLSLANVGGIDKQDVEYSVFTKGDTIDGGIWLYGDTYMTKCPKNKLNEMVTINNVIGYQASYQGDYDDAVKELKRQGASVVSSQTLDGVLIIYGLSDKAGRAVQVDGKAVNIQLAIRGKSITVGTPLIMGSY